MQAKEIGAVLTIAQEMIDRGLVMSLDENGGRDAIYVWRSDDGEAAVMAVQFSLEQLSTWWDGFKAAEQLQRGKGER